MSWATFQAHRCWPVSCPQQPLFVKLRCDKWNLRFKAAARGCCRREVCHREQMAAGLDAPVAPASPLEVVCSATEIRERETCVVEAFVYSGLLGLEEWIRSTLFYPFWTGPSSLLLNLPSHSAWFRDLDTIYTLKILSLVPDPASEIISFIDGLLFSVDLCSEILLGGCWVVFSAPRWCWEEIFFFFLLLSFLNNTFWSMQFSWSMVWHNIMCEFVRKPHARPICLTHLPDCYI